MCDIPCSALIRFISATIRREVLPQQSCTSPPPCGDTTQDNVLYKVNYLWCLISAEHAIGNKVHAVFEGWVLMFTKPIHRSGWHSSCDLKILVGENQISEGTVPPTTNRGGHN